MISDLSASSGSAAFSEPDPLGLASQPQGTWARLVRSARRERAIVAGLLLVACVLTLVLGAGTFARLNPDTQFPDGLSADGQPVAPGAAFMLGTDPLGRDMWSRILYGGRISLLVALVSNAVALILGLMFGLPAGFYGGWVDLVCSRIIDTMLAFPAVLFGIALSSATKPSVGIAMLSISLISWAPVARVVRGQVLSLKQRGYVEAARALGMTGTPIMLRHVLPQLISPLVVLIALSIPSAILLEAVLSYLGAGVPPTVPSWGNLIQDGTRYFRTAPWIVLYPGLAIFVTVLGFNLAGDGLRDLLDPRRVGN